MRVESQNHDKMRVEISYTFDVKLEELNRKFDIKFEENNKNVY